MIASASIPGTLLNDLGMGYRGFEHLDDALAEAGRGRRSAHFTHIPDLDSVIPVLG